MYVQVKITLSVSPTQDHREAMQAAALSLTNDKSSVQIFVPEDQEKLVVAFFTIKQARQRDVVDKIGKAFHMINDYQGSTILFPPKPPIWYQPTLSRKITSKQRQYLAFIYYYTKINGRSPAQHDMQKYFQVTPPAVHNMILTLEKKGFITKIPHQPRSIKLLVSRAEIPDLD